MKRLSGLLNRLIMCIVGLAVAVSALARVPEVSEILTTAQPAPADSVALPNPITVAADSALLQFWDAVDFTCDEIAGNKRFMKPTFTHFISLFSLASEQGRDAAADRLYALASVNPRALAVIDELVDDNLSEQWMEMYNLLYYNTFLTSRLRCAAEPEWALQRAQILYDQLHTNYPGSICADFSMTLSDGSQSSLYQLLATDRPNLLIFYSPICEDCHKAMERIAAEPAFADLNIIAVTDEDDVDEWRRDLPFMPADWLVGYTGGEVQAAETYVIPTVPAIYLLGTDGRVIMKNARVDDLLHYLQRPV